MVYGTSARAGLIGLVRTADRNRTLGEILSLPVETLLGVDADSAAALTKLGIGTVFDLATSAIFANACKLVDAASDTKSPLFQHGTPTADMVIQSGVAGKKITEIQFLSIDVLSGISSADRPNLEKVLGVLTVRDLAFYPPYRAAMQLLNAAYFPDNVAGYDPEMPSDLLPKSGEYPTERVQYTTLIMDEIKFESGTPPIDMLSSAFEPIDITRLSKGDTGFKKLALGALLTINQSWFVQGVTLGQLLHSVALAPGESTRIAVIDWSRKSRAGETEVIAETDDLSSDATHNRAISEVTEAVANEAQSGFSSNKTNSTSKQSGRSQADDGGSFLGGLFGDSTSSSGASSGEASSQVNSDSYSTSSGHRDIGSSMLQNVNDRTHQNAHSSRSRRASVIKEVSQSEHENVSTRVLANYNHMHALTVQYYEVVQVYRTEVAVVKADKVVFIPIALIDFDNDDTIRRFRDALARRALTFEIRDALRNLDVIAINPEPATHFSALNGNLRLFLTDVVLTRSAQLISSVAPAVPVVRAAAAGATSPALNLDPINVHFSAKIPPVQQANAILWSPDQISRISGLTGRAAVRAGSNAIYLPTDVTIEGATVSGSDRPLTVLFFRRQGGAATGVSVEAPLALSEVIRVALQGSSDRDVNATITLTVNRNGVRFPIELPAVKVGSNSTGETRVVTVEPGGVNVNLKQHLNANKLHYSQVVYRSLDSTQIAVLLSGFGLEVENKLVPISQLIEPTPIRYVGNYLAFKMNSDPEHDKTWAEFLDTHGIHLGRTQEDIVPLATGGTFAEAVLGRSNSAEKLDFTRFWNWQDSPIPLQPTEIAAIQTGSRASNEDVKPGQLSNPIINITSPTSLPDPSGTAAILAAIQNGNMFRDMSGLQATIGAAQSALQATAAGAATAGQQAGTNMKTLVDAATERQRVAADLIASVARTAAAAYTNGAVSAGGGITSGSNHSQDGAKVNYFDKTKSPAPAGGATSGGTGTVPAGGNSGGSASAGPLGGGTAGGGDVYSQNPAALAATWGDSQPPSGLLTRIVDKIPNDLGEGDLSGGSPLTTRKAWPKLSSDVVLSRIKDLTANPNLIDQGVIGLCTSAAFFHHIIQKDAAKFDSFAKAVYGGGIGFLGNLKVDPSIDLRNTDYAALAARFPGMPPQADWMLMSSLRDSRNWIVDFEGAPDESTALSTTAKEASGWYTMTGLYSNVAFDPDTSLVKIKAIKKVATNHVALTIRVSLIQQGSGLHMITVESPIVVDEGNDKVTFDYWTWGQPVKTLATTLTAFKANYLGVIVATF